MLFIIKHTQNILSFIYELLYPQKQFKFQIYSKRKTVIWEKGHEATITINGIQRT